MRRPFEVNLRGNLEERLQQPRVPSAKLREHADRYKIKLRDAGYRPIYEVHDGELRVVVIAVGRRHKSEVYDTADKR
jgi:mRNA interferase RelE/StbE